jgi:hypothetical protein
MDFPRRWPAAFSLILLIGCAGDPVARGPGAAATLAAADIYTPRAGDVWTFVNGYGDTTTITSEAAPDPVACRSGRNIVWHYRKNAARAYWNPGVAEAELLFVLHQNPDSSWRSTASVISLPQVTPATQTWDILDSPPGVPIPYQSVPPTLHQGDTLVYETLADAIGGYGLFTLACTVPDGELVAQLGHGEEWRTEFYVEDVTTPVYSGPAAVTEARENCNAAYTNPGCGHEKWWFAPGFGLVKVWQLNTGSGVDGDEDPKLIMLRVK